MIAITGGGTGGHLAIAKAVCEELNKRGIKPIFIGSKKGQDEAWFGTHEGFEHKYFLQTSGVVDKKGFAKISALKEILKQSLFCNKIFKQHNISKVFSVGGYSSAPASIASILSFKPLFIHEQNAKMGRLNKLMKPFAKEVFGSYENATFSLSYPVRDIFFENFRIREKLKTIIFLGGSGGASFINNLAKQMAINLNQNHIKIIHQCGKHELKELQEFYKQNGIDADVFDFSDTLHEKMKMADFAISRAGASTLWELVATGLPTFFIPYPYAASNHQYYNAKNLSDENLAFLSLQQNVDEKEIFDIFKSVDLSFISSNLCKKISQNGVKQMVDRLV